MSELATPPRHRLSAAVAAARSELAGVADVPVWSMSAVEVTEALDELAAHESQVAALRSRLIMQAEAVEASESLSTPNWLARRLQLTRPETHRRTRLATGLDVHPVTATALSGGRINEEQALAIIGGLSALPDDLDPALVLRAEEHLIELAGDYDAKSLKGFGRTILEVVAPDLADAHLARQLERLERDAEAANRFRVWDTPAGRVRGDFDLDGFSGACLKKALFAHAAPKHRASKGPLGERKPTAERLGEAFAEYVRRYPKNKLPNAGGLNATVVVLMSYETLMGDLKAARLDTGEHISAGQARLVACEAGIIPAVLGGKSEVLDLGRSRRLHSRAQRIKATIEQVGCIAEGHDCPPAFTQMHHPTPWAEGGRTDGDGWMLCPTAHRRAHDPRYTHERLPNGKVRFHRRE
jgi:Domain of unknown function (DUF222)